MAVLRTRQRPDAGPAEVEATRRRFLRRRRARRLLVWRRILVAALAVGAAAFAVWALFFSSWLAVHGLEVRGTEVLTRDEVEAAAAVPTGVPLATADLDAAEARVEGLAAVASAEASRAWPDRVRIDVTERRAVAVVDWEGSWRGLDAEGVLFRTYEERPADLPLVLITPRTPVEALAEAAAVVEAVPSAVAARLEDVRVGSVDDISLSLRGGVTVRWGSADASADKAAVLEVLLRQKARVYDVTAPGRPTIAR